MRPRLNHVIFLGAGASYTSGYPIGQKLRLLMASKEYFSARLDKLYPHQSPSSTDPIYASKLKCLEYFGRFAKSIELFRRGGFATVDEFSKLASESYPEHVQNMKKLMCLILAMHNPEAKFQKSDYYPFIQRLFRNDSLNHFRNEISVITFNYDCYLDYVLRDALRYRRAVSNFKSHPNVLPGSQELTEPWSSKLSSGFFIQESDKTLAWKEDQFNYFKLHGSIAYGGRPANFGYERLFGHAAPKRFEFLDDDWFVKHYVPPVVFPWELFDSNSGKFISEDDFIFTRRKDEISRRDGKKLFEHFKIMWESARHSVARADKISFIGLSMHEYLEGGLKYLFDGFGKETNPVILQAIELGAVADKPEPKRVEVVVANPENDQFRNSENRRHPASLCGRVSDLLQKVAPNMRYVRSSSENDGIFRKTDSPHDKEDPDITPRYTFKEFIEREME